MIEHQPKPAIEEWRLAYAPQNELLDNFVDQVCSDLGLLKCFGVDNRTDLERTVISRKLIAGIQFHNADVSYAMVGRVI